MNINNVVIFINFRLKKTFNFKWNKLENKEDQRLQKMSLINEDYNTKDNHNVKFELSHTKLRSLKF